MTATSVQRKGDLSVSQARSWLIANGYDTFSNDSYFGPIDIIARKGPEFLLLDVKSNPNSPLTEEQNEIGVRILSVDEQATAHCTRCSFRRNPR